MAADWTKGPDATLDWRWDWTDWLADGETITAPTMTVSAGLVHTSDSHSPTSATAWLSCGTPGTPYLVANPIVTSAAGRTDERSVTIRVTNR
ncbi:phage fiber-tail adaptor protein [Streptomyces rimosus]|uniref:phage fiber-tail adaptor protein n=1 Tax=Streptomyces rimosus TaxID=1927 RepID=UPI00378B2D91